MKKIASVAALVLISLTTMPATSLAREPVPIVDYNDITVVTGNGKPVTADQIRTAITTAANNLQWEVKKSPNQDLLSATLHVRNKHTVVVSIPYSVEKYSIRYESSVNMKYRPAGATASVNYNAASTVNYSFAGAAQTTGTAAVIHPYYNRWVQELMKSINDELNKL
jgi:hypothetical protein